MASWLLNWTGDQRRRWREGGASVGFRIQLPKPIQSVRERPRDALRLHRLTFHSGGRYLRTNFTERSMACFWPFMQRHSHWQI